MADERPCPIVRCHHHCVEHMKTFSDSTKNTFWTFRNKCISLAVAKYVIAFTLYYTITEMLGERPCPMVRHYFCHFMYM